MSKKVVRYKSMIVTLEGEEEMWNDVIVMTTVKEYRNGEMVRGFQTTFENWIEFLAFLQQFAAFAEDYLVGKVMLRDTNMLEKLKELVRECENLGKETIEYNEPGLYGKFKESIRLKELKDAVETYEQTLRILKMLRNLDLEPLKLFTRHTLGFWIEEVEKYLKSLGGEKNE